MKKIIILTFFTLFTSNLLAETGKFNASGMGSWEVNVMDAGNGNMSITYDGNAGLSDKEDGSIFNKSTMHCIGGLTLTAGKFDDETGMCTFYLSDGEILLLAELENMKTFQVLDFQVDKILKAKVVWLIQ